MSLTFSVKLVSISHWHYIVADYITIVCISTYFCTRAYKQLTKAIKTYVKSQGYVRLRRSLVKPDLLKTNWTVNVHILTVLPLDVI